MLRREDSLLVLVDIQEKLFSVMHEREVLQEQLVRLVQGCLALEIPVICFEQNPSRMGSTIGPLQVLLPSSPPLAKMAFSCAGEPGLRAMLSARLCPQVLVAGIEAHVCVYQTVAGLAEAGIEAYVVADAVSSRTAANCALGLELCRQAGGKLTGVESALFEWLRTAEDPVFKTLLNVVK